MSQVWEVDDPELKDARLLTLLSLADHADDYGDNCYPSIPRLAQRARISERQAQRVIAWLEEHGYIHIVEKGNGRGRKTQYKITVKGVMVSPIETTKGDTTSPIKRKKGDIEKAKRVTLATEKGDIGDIKRVTLETQITPILADDPSLEPSIEPSIVEAPAARTPQQELFGAVCEAIGADYRTLSKEDRGQVAQTCHILGEAEYTPADIAKFMQTRWFHDWRWTEKRSYPTLNQLRKEIGQIRNTVAAAAPASVGKNLQGVADYLNRQRSAS